MSTMLLPNAYCHQQSNEIDKHKKRDVLLAKQFFMSIKLSQLDSKVRILTEQVALNEEKVERDKLDL